MAEGPGAMRRFPQWKKSAKRLRRVSERLKSSSFLSQALLRALFYEQSCGQEDAGTAHQGEDYAGKPELGYACAPQDDSAQNLDIVRCRDQVADRLEDGRHVFDEEDV